MNEAADKIFLKNFCFFCLIALKRNKQESRFIFQVKDKKTERQKDRETERQKDRKK
jgi:hypothetical protein